MPLLRRKRVLLAKIEASYGVDSVPVGTTNAMLVRNMTLTPMQIEYASRDLIRPFLGNFDQLPNDPVVQIEFEVEVAGSSALGVAPQYGPLLRACGMSETITAITKVEYKPISAAFESVSIIYNEDGLQHKVLGCRGTVAIEMPLKGIPVFRFRLLGLYQTPTDTALPSATYTNFKTPKVVNNTNTTAFSLHAFSGIASAFSVDLANELAFRALIGGSKQVLQTDRKVIGSVTIEKPTVAAKDFWTAIKDGVLGAVSITHGPAGNQAKFDGAQVQLTEPTEEDLDGIAMLRMNMIVLPTTAGNDELTLTIQ